MADFLPKKRTFIEFLTLSEKAYLDELIRSLPGSVGSGSPARKAVKTKTKTK